MFKKNFLIPLLSIVIFSSCTKEPKYDEVTPPQVIEEYKFSETTKEIQTNSKLFRLVHSDTTIVLHSGVKEIDIHYNNRNNEPMRLFILKIDMNNTDLKLQPLTPSGGETYGMQTISDMVKYVSSDTKLIGAVNSDYFDRGTGEPRSIVYLNGKAIRSIIPESRSFFGVSKSGKLMMGEGLSYEQQKDDIFNALGGHHVLIKNGRMINQTDVTVEPRTAVGYTSGNILYFVVIDGRRTDYSNGISLRDLSELMQALKVQEAINLDGGGSSTFLINNPKTSTFDIRNWPSDSTPRVVANGWAIVSMSK